MSVSLPGLFSCRSRVIKEVERVLQIFSHSLLTILPAQKLLAGGFLTFVVIFVVPFLSVVVVVVVVVIVVVVVVSLFVYAAVVAIHIDD